MAVTFMYPAYIIMTSGSDPTLEPFIVDGSTIKGSYVAANLTKVSEAEISIVTVNNIKIFSNNNIYFDSGLIKSNKCICLDIKVYQDSSNYQETNRSFIYIGDLGEIAISHRESPVGIKRIDVQVYKEIYEFTPYTE